MRFVPISVEQATRLELEQNDSIASRVHPRTARLEAVAPESAVVRDVAEKGERPRVVYRPSGDHHLLVEYGPMQLDLASRMRAGLRPMVDAPVRKVQVDQLALFDEDEAGTNR